MPGLRECASLLADLHVACAVDAVPHVRTMAHEEIQDISLSRGISKTLWWWPAPCDARVAGGRRLVARRESRVLNFLRGFFYSFFPDEYSCKHLTTLQLLQLTLAVHRTWVSGCARPGGLPASQRLIGAWGQTHDP